MGHNLEAAINKLLCINSVIDVIEAISPQLCKLTFVAASLSAFMFVIFYVNTTKVKNSSIERVERVKISGNDVNKSKFYSGRN